MEGILMLGLPLVTVLTVAYCILVSDVIKDGWYK